MRPADVPPPTLPLLCALGRHKTDGLARWNAGYYFAKCKRCRRDLVRTAFTRWEIPKGFRIVWQSDAAHHAGSPEMVAQDHYPAPAGQVEFPIREAAPLPEPSLEPGADAVEPVDAARCDFDEGEADESDASASLEQTATGELPIQEVLRNLRDDYHGQSPAHDFEESERDVLPAGADVLEEDGHLDDEPSEAADEPPPREPEDSLPPAPPTKRYPVVPDFMDESPAGIGWDVIEGRIVPKGQTETDAGGHSAGDAPAGFLSQGWQDLVRKKAGDAGMSGRALFRDMRARRRPPARKAAPASIAAPASVANSGTETTTRVDRRARLGGMLMQQAPIAAAMIFGGLVVAAAYVDSRNGPRVIYRPVPVASVAQAEVPQRSTTPPGTARRQPATTPINPTQRAYVTASLLNCRALPDDKSATVRRLPRGASVELLGERIGWFSVAHQGRQCWAYRDYISTTRPV